MSLAVVPGACPLCGPEAAKVPWARGPDFEYRTTGDQEFSFQRCSGCGIVFLDPRPADEAIPGLYPPDYEPYRFHELPAVVRAARDRLQRAKARAVLDAIGGRGTVVDVGCGNGSFLRAARALSGGRVRLVGWDYPGPGIERVAADGFEVIVGPVDLDHAPRDVDALVMLQLIEHVPDPGALLRSAWAALRPGGILFVETPNLAGPDARWFRARHWGGYHIPRHLVLFDDQNLAALLRAHGFAPETRADLASPAFWVQSAHHWLSERPGGRRLARLATLQNPLAAAAAVVVERAAVRSGRTSNQRWVARKVV